MASAAMGRGRNQNVLRVALRCTCNAASAVCFGCLLLLTLGPVFLSPAASQVLAGDAIHGLSGLARVCSVPLAEAGIVLAVLGGTMSAERRQRNLAAAVAGLIGAFAVLRSANVI